MPRGNTCRVVLGAALLFAGGCGVTEKRTQTVVDRNQTHLASRRVAGLDRTDVLVRTDAEGALVRVSVERQCRALVQEEWLIEEHIERQPKPAGAIVGGSLLATGGFFLLIGRQQSKADGQAEGEANSVLGFVLALGGALTLLIDLARYSEDARQFRSSAPPREIPEPCLGEAPSPHSVTLILPNGFTLNGQWSPTGVARVPIGDEIWDAFGDRLDVDVLVDGVPMRRAVLVRKTR